MVETDLAPWPYTRTSRGVTIMPNEERELTNEPVEPDPLAKHTLYAIAWGILPSPQRYADMSFLGDIAQQARDRLRVKRQCRAYAKSRGFQLQLMTQHFDSEEWAVWREGTGMGTAQGITQGSLQECCLRIVEYDTWPDGKPE